MLIAYITTISMNFLSIFKRKRTQIIIIITLIVFTIIAGGSLSNPDWDGYLVLYRSVKSNSLSVEPGYRLVELMITKLGVSYEGFRFIIAIMMFAYLYYLLSIYIGKKSFSLFLLSYSMFSVFYDCIQLRNFIGFLFVIHGIYFLINDNKFGVWKYIIFVLIGSSFQFLMIAYLLFIVFRFKYKSVWLFFLIMISMCIVFLTIINNMTIPFINSIVPIIMNDKLNTYLKATTRFGSLYIIILQICNFFFVYYLSRLKKVKIQNNAVLFINAISFVFVPLFTVNLNLYRLSRNLILINLIYSQLVFNDTTNKSIKIKIFLITILYISIWIAYGFVLQSEWEPVVKGLLYNNSIIK